MDSGSITTQLRRVRPASVLSPAGANPGAGYVFRPPSASSSATQPSAVSRLEKSCCGLPRSSGDGHVSLVHWLIPVGDPSGVLEALVKRSAEVAAEITSKVGYAKELAARISPTSHDGSQK